MSAMAEVEALSYSPSSMPSTWTSSRGAMVAQQSGSAIGGLTPSPTTSTTSRRPLAATNSNAVAQTIVSSHRLHSHGTSKTLDFTSSALGNQNNVAVVQARDVRKQNLGSLATRSLSKPYGPLNGAAVGAIGDGRKFSGPQTVHSGKFELLEADQTASVLRTLALTPPSSMGSTLDTTKSNDPGSHIFQVSSVYPSSYDPLSSTTPLSQPLVTPHGVTPNDPSADYFASAYHQLNLSLNSHPYPSIAFDSTRPSIVDLQDALFRHSLADISQGVSLPASSSALSSQLFSSQPSSTVLPLGNHPTRGIWNVQDAPIFVPSKAHQSAPYFQPSNHVYHPRPESPYWGLPQNHTGAPREAHEHHSMSSVNTSKKIDAGAGDWVTSAPVNVGATYPADGNSIYHPAPLVNVAHPAWIQDPSHWPTGSTSSQGALGTTQSSNQVVPTSPITSLPTPRTSPRDSTSSASGGFDKLDTLPPFIMGNSNFEVDFNMAQYSLSPSATRAGTGLASSPWATTAPDAISSSQVNIETKIATALNSSLLHSVPAGSSYAPAPVPFAPHYSDSQRQASRVDDDEALNFLNLLQPHSRPPYHVLVHRIVKRSDQQASIFIQQKLKNANHDERGRIVSAIAERGLEMMQGRFGNWCVQRCLESPCTVEERMKILACMIGHVVELATNCYGTHVVQKALECEEEIRRVIVAELLNNDPSYTLTSKHCSHVWAKVMELTWVNGPPPPIFSTVNHSLRGKWASLACHETGSLVVQTMFENMDDEKDKLVIVDEILNNLDDVVKTQFGAFVVQHIVEHGDSNSSQRTALSLIDNLVTYGTHDIAVKSILKLLKEKNPVMISATISKMCEYNAHGTRQKRPIVVDLALSANGSQIIQAVLPEANKDQRARLYDAVKGHTVTLRGCKTGSRVIWLFDRMRAYYGY